MVDLHCHILPGLDDGPRAISESLEMAEAAIAQGVTHIVATPHSSNDFFFDYPKVRALCKELQDLVGNRLKIATGCDFHLNPENLVSLHEQAPRFCINQKDYLLVEFNEISIPPAMDFTLHELQLAGLHPVVTHPERNSILRTHPERLASWVRSNCYGQVTAGALTGQFGTRAQRDASRWIEEGLIHFVASDAHNTTTRPLRLQPAFDIVAEQFGPEKARALFTENPLAAFEGRELPHIPHLEEPPAPTRRKRFIFF